MNVAANNIAGAFAGAQQAAQLRAVTDRRERARSPKDVGSDQNEGDRFDLAAPVEETSAGDEHAKDATDHRVEAAAPRPHGQRQSKADSEAHAVDRGGHIDLRG